MYSKAYKHLTIILELECMCSTKEPSSGRNDCSLPQHSYDRRELAECNNLALFQQEKLPPTQEEHAHSLHLHIFSGRLM